MCNGENAENFNNCAGVIDNIDNELTFIWTKIISC